MKSIFKFVNVGILMAALIALGTLAGFAQNVCEDADGIAALDAKIRELFPKTDKASRQAKIDAGKQFLEKWGNCGESTKEFSDYLKTNIPKWQASLDKMAEDEKKNALVNKFNEALKTKNWDDVYTTGQELISSYGDEFRAAELVLGSIGLDETAKATPVTKWNEQTIRYAKQSIAEIESGKTFKTYGVPPFSYPNKETALAWMNYTIGYIYFYDKKDKKTGLTYIYKASQMPDTKTNPVVYESIGSYYFDDVRKLVAEVKTLIDAQKPEDTAEVAQQKVDAIKAKVGILNGTAERALDAYSRAYKLVDPADKTKSAYRDRLRKIMEDLFKVRFAKPDVTLDAWVATATAKPFPDPMSTIAPINDPEPPTTTTGTTGTSVGTPNGTSAGTPSGTGIGAGNGTGIGNQAAKPASTSTTAPAKPAGPKKPRK